MSKHTPYNVNAMQNSGKRQHESATAKKCVFDTAFNDALLDILEKVKRVEKDVKELRADMESRSVTINSTSQLPTLPVIPTPPKVLSPPSLAWVPSPPSPAVPTPLVLPPTLASPAVPPGLNKPLPPLPPTTETTHSRPPKSKPDLEPFVHTIDPVTPEKAHPPHPPSLSTTGVVLFSLLLLHHQGSYHWLVIFQPEFLEPSGICPDPEPPPFCSGNGTGFTLQLFIIF